MEKLFISIDPGCDAFKVVINKKVFRISSNVQKTNIEEMKHLTGDQKPENYILLKKEYVKDGEKLISNYAVGYLAQLNQETNRSVAMRYGILESRDNKKLDEGSEYFLSSEFLVGCEAMIGYAMYYYSQETSCTLNELQEAEIYCSIALPHSSVDRYSNAVISRISGNHKYGMTIGRGNNISFSYNIDSNNVFIASQVLAAVYGELLDDEGQAVEDPTIKAFPTLVIDGGYRTLGLVNVRQNYFIDEREAESNLDYAMVNINERVSKLLNENFNTNLLEFEIEDRISRNDKELKYEDKESGKWLRTDLEKIRDEEADKVIEEMVKYLDKKYNRLSDNKEILITGGTGKYIFDRLKKIFTGRSQFNENEIILTKAPFNGKECDPVFAITVGSYKAMLNQLSAE